MSILKEIYDSVINMDEENIENLIEKAINAEGIDVYDIYSKGLVSGMRKALDLYDKKEYDVPEVIVCADTLNKGVKLLNSYGGINNEINTKIILAVVEGDTHEIGKNIVKIMLEAAGHTVIDMGVNQPSKDIISTAIKEKAKIIGLSSMMTTTRGEMKKLIDEINSMDLVDKPYIIVGGGSITTNYSKEINSDGYATSAPNAVRLVEELLEGANR